MYSFKYESQNRVFHIVCENEKQPEAKVFVQDDKHELLYSVQLCTSSR